ncbi:PREDICTED: DDB1- and CUL4-associated factor 11 [Dinoponera quadriceps]|uniref:DDB1- and CUL4-associated factor 11 n=1 Tax=Dinoponera quadriceps TaxID=609295 RepID=A0A6P3XI75_DINQU|nr:PREDICTED: DDB1- and CUL4-associated factor 11 [Dinoponera quadriceps]
MGGISSRTMDSVCDPDFIFLLHYSRRSSSHLLNGVSDESDVEPDDDLQRQQASVSNANRLDKKEISFAIKQACEITDSSRKQNTSIVSMIQKRTIGSAFNTIEKCCINNNLLPNRFDLISNHKSKIFCGTYSNDGKFFLTASQDKVLHLYHTHNGEFNILKTIPARDVGWSVLDTAFSPDGENIVYSSWSECLYQCSVSKEISTQEMLSLNPGVRRFCVFSLVFSNDGREILGGANSGYLYFYDRGSNQRISRFEGHGDDVNSVAFADGSSQIFYSAGDDGLCKVWDRRTVNAANPIAVGTLAGHRDGITYIDSRGDGRYLITNSKDQTIKLWDIRALSNKIGMMNTRKAIRDLDWDYRWQHVPKRLRRAKEPMDGDTSVMTFRGHCVRETLIRCHFSPAATTGQRYIYTGCSMGRVYIYDILTGKIVRNLFAHEMCVRDVSWHPFYPYIVSTSWDCKMVRWRYMCDEMNALNDRRPEKEIKVKPQPPPRRSERIAAQRTRQP